MAVLRPAIFGVLSANRNLFTVAYGRQALAGDSQRLQIIQRRLSTFDAERHVIFIGPTLIAVTFDLHLSRGIGFQPLRIAFECGPRLLGKFVSVYLELGVL